jgi:hypothetical protein
MTDLVQSCGPLRLTKSCPTPTGGIELPVVKYILAARVLWPGLRSTNCVEFRPGTWHGTSRSHANRGGRRTPGCITSLGSSATPAWFELKRNKR